MATDDLQTAGEPRKAVVTITFHRTVERQEPWDDDEEAEAMPLLVCATARFELNSQDEDGMPVSRSYLFSTPAASVHPDADEAELETAYQEQLAMLREDLVQIAPALTAKIAEELH